MKIRPLLLTALLGLASAAAFGATPAPAASTRPAAMKPHGMCAKNPNQCIQLAGKFDQWCQANAQKCSNFKAHIEKRREWCEKNPAKCRAIRRRMRDRIQKHRENMQNNQNSGSGSGGNR